MFSNGYAFFSFFGHILLCAVQVHVLIRRCRHRTVFVTIDGHVYYFICCFPTVSYPCHRWPHVCIHQHSEVFHQILWLILIHQSSLYHFRAAACLTCLLLVRNSATIIS